MVPDYIAKEFRKILREKRPDQYIQFNSYYGFTRTVSKRRPPKWLFKCPFSPPVVKQIRYRLKKRYESRVKKTKVMVPRCEESFTII